MEFIIENLPHKKKKRLFGSGKDESSAFTKEQSLERLNTIEAMMRIVIVMNHFYSIYHSHDTWWFTGYFLQLWVIDKVRSSECFSALPKSYKKWQNCLHNASHQGRSLAPGSLISFSLSPMSLWCKRQRLPWEERKLWNPPKSLNTALCGIPSCCLDSSTTWAARDEELHFK